VRGFTVALSIDAMIRGVIGSVGAACVEEIARSAKIVVKRGFGMCTCEKSTNHSDDVTCVKTYPYSTLVSKPPPWTIH